MVIPRVAKNLLTVAIVLVVSTGCGNPNAGDSVAVLGDSITTLDEADLNTKFGDEYELAISGNFGKTVEQVIDEAEFLGDLNYEQVIVNIGTNDALQKLPTDGSIESLKELISNFESARCIHLVNINENMLNLQAGESAAEEAQAFNAELNKLVDDDSQLSMIDWQSETSKTLNDKNPPTSTLTKDSVHPTAEGNQVLNDLYASALESC